MQEDVIVLTEENYESYAMAHYSNRSCRGMDEFKEDLNNQPKWIKRLLKKFDAQNTIRLILINNHITGYYNSFGAEAGTRLLFYKIDSELHVYLNTILSAFEKYDPDIIIQGKHRIGEIGSDDLILRLMEEEN